MKRCPRCDGSYPDDDVFCEFDGARLVGGAPIVVSPAAASAPRLVEPAEEPPASACVVCGAAQPDDGDEYCAACGHRIEPVSGAPIVPLGATIGRPRDGWVVTAKRTVDDVLAASSDGTPVLVASGDASILADEATAVRALAGHPGAPALVDLGRDERRGAFLVLSAPPAGARALAEAAPGLDASSALALARSALDVVEILERAGLRWIPRSGDGFVDAHGALVLARVRAAPLAGPRAAACCAVAALGRSLAPVPVVNGTPRMLRALVGPDCDLPHVVRDAPAMREELEAVARDLKQSEEGPRHAAVECDGGLRRGHNEDATAMATGHHAGEPWTVLVVCDGVSCSSHAEKASSIAAKTACDALAHFARAGDIAHEAASSAVAAAIRAAHIAVCTAPIERVDGEPPGTTIVAGLVYRRRLTVGWVGDSRAYWIGKGGSELLTRDHSWASEVIDRGEMTEEQAMRDPLAHALTRCLGPLEEDENTGFRVEPEVRTRDLPGAGYVVLCSDGLWNYFPEARSIAALVHGAADASPRRVAQLLVNHALLRGGGDNVTVAVLAHGQ